MPEQEVPFSCEHEYVEDPLFVMSRNNDEDCNNIKASSILTGENVPLYC